MRGIGGFWRTERRRRRNILPALLLAALTPQAALARDAAVAIPSTTLDAALIALARETGIEIVSTESGLRAIRTPAIEGRMTPARALARLLEGSGYRAIASGGGYRIVPARTRPPAPPRPPRTAASPAGPDIVITASKQRIPELRYPGSLTTIPGTPDLPGAGAGTMRDVTAHLPILQGTDLGSGRDKFFIRGIADSSFNGSTQSPASIYLDDVQLTYSGPDPGLRLYDMESVDVMEGPQGTLYGSGAIGGVIRLTSNPVDLTRLSASVAGGGTATEGGGAGGDIAGMVNLPMIDDRVGLRLVGYHALDGGFITDRARGAERVNRTATSGGRAALRLDPGDAWRIEISGAGQTIDTADGQYAERVEGALARRTQIAQPFDNRLLFGRLVVTRDWASGLRLVVASGIVGYRSHDQFDATSRTAGVPGPLTIYRAHREKRLLSNETRLSRSLANGNSWVAGFSIVTDRDSLSRTVATPGGETNIVGVTNTTNAVSAFGEATLAVTPRLSLTAGGRFTDARTDGDPSSTPRPASTVHGQPTRRVDPTVALSWQIDSRLAVFARFQTGFRTGGLAVTAGLGRTAVYEHDSIAVGEIGFRLLRRGPTGLAVSGGVSRARWYNIQADLINRRGLPYTDNIGDAHIQTAEAAIDWIPLVGLRARASFLYTDNQVFGPIADQSRRNNRRLPETPPLAAHADLGYQWAAGRLTPHMAMTVDYVGRSVLGTGDLLDVSQGNYWVAGLAASVRVARTEFSLTVANLTDRRANTFSFGNPFTLVARDQTTPIRPRNLRFGIATSW